MPYKDPEKKLERMRDWRKQKMGEGYGRWLYARRKLRFDALENFKDALERIRDDATHLDGAKLIASEALHEALKAEEKLGDFDDMRRRELEKEMKVTQKS